MLASVANQGERVKVPIDNESNRFPGLRPILITNDQMRDHKLTLLAPRLFRRWTSCHIVKYSLSPDDVVDSDVEASAAEKPVKVSFFPAKFFSREIQGNKLPKQNDSIVWHLPVSGWPEDDRLCISVLLLV